MPVVICAFAIIFILFIITLVLTIIDHDKMIYWFCAMCLSICLTPITFQFVEPEYIEIQAVYFEIKE